MSTFLYRIQPVRVGMLTDAPTEHEKRLVAEHFSYLQRLVAEGIVHMAGRTLNTDERAFGIVIFDAESEEAARRIMKDDPAVKHNIMRAEFFPFRVALWSPKLPGVHENGS